MCDPVFQDCPTEDPTGPSVADIPKEAKPIEEDVEKTFTDAEIFNANLQIDAAMTVAFVYLVLDTTAMKKMASYVLMTETTYPSVIGTSATNYWKLAN